MISPSQHQAIIESLRQSSLKGADLRQYAMQKLDELPLYEWSGVYVLDNTTLVLDQYVGEPTEHTHIAVGKGVCGTAVAENRNQIVDDVRSLSNYLACSLKTRAELVVLIRDINGNILGQIDIDGHQIGAFDATDEALLEDMAKILAESWN